MDVNPQGQEKGMGGNKGGRNVGRCLGEGKQMEERRGTFPSASGTQASHEEAQGLEATQKQQKAEPRCVPRAGGSGEKNMLKKGVSLSFCTLYRETPIIPYPPSEGNWGQPDSETSGRAKGQL